MRIVVALIALVVMALLGSRRTFVARSLPFGAQMVFLTGTEFLLVGLLLGSDFLNLIDRTTLVGLRPFLAATLGWIGFLFGLQFERRALKNLPHGILAGSILQALVTMVTVFAIFWFLLASHAGSVPGLWIGVAVLAASAACTGQAAIVLVDRHRPPERREVMTSLRFISSLDPAVGILGFGAALALFGTRPGYGGAFPEWAKWLVLSVALGCVMAWIFVSLTLTRTSQSELVVYLLGTIVLASGVAIYFGLSALFVNFICGVVVANLAQVRAIRGRAVELMVQGEKFVYVVMLVIVGALWRLPTWTALALAATYVGARMAGKLGGGFLVARLWRHDRKLPGHLGLGLTSQAGMAVVIMIDYLLAIHGPLTQMVVSIGVLGIIANEFVAPGMVMRVAGPVAESV